MKKQLISKISFVLVLLLLILAAMPMRPVRAAATRFYLQNVASSVTTIDQGTWNDASGIPTLVMSRIKSGTITSRSVAETSSSNPFDVMLLKFVSEPLPAQVIAAGSKLTWAIGAQESDKAANDHFKVHAYVVSNDGATIRETILSNNVDGTNPSSEWPSTAQGSTPSSAKTLSAFTIQANDRIVIEIGYDAQNSSITSYTGALWYGGTGADLTTGGDETTLTGWFEFSNLAADTTGPTVDTFTVTTPSANLTIPITAFTASDDLGVTGYMVTTSSTPPAVDDPGWADTAPGTFTVASDGSYTLYPWARDAAGNVSNIFPVPPTVEVDTTRPAVDGFAATTPSNTLNIPITAFTATDNVAVTGYLITTSSTPPAVDDPGWAGTAQGTFTVASDGTYTLYPWAKDAAGNVSNIFSAPPTVDVDTTKPTVNSFAVTTTSKNLNIPITAFTATDNVAVTGYLITSSSTPPESEDPGWAGTAPATFTVASDGTYTLYPWARDAAGNVSNLFATPPTVNVDTISPNVVSIVRTSLNPTNATSVNFTITFSEGVSGVGVGDFILSKAGTITGASITGVSGGPIIYTVSVNTGFRNGTLRLDVPASATITDLAGNLLAGLPYTNGETYTINKLFTIFMPLIMR